ncbi:Dedicator of cytokinesis family protein [Tritrichomonas foetus]|uniref:Dedicator of cytokinesis family protein n=1 Tax=Tritrichomonas foetus TaxID=1144522 RepID=A0A1J4K324_9EUKA|nr:Dedicator of cytokinesis family protein [Tritrichomonas foetus]|eukprot:OHT03901.1 Dedicator of cytokinesis family protein [Tritrichomonas foetus]
MKSNENAAINEWCKQNKELFKRHNIFKSSISIVKDQDTDLFQPVPNIPDEYHHPGVDFYKYSSIYLNRDNSFKPPTKHAFSEPNRSLFIFDKSQAKEDKMHLRMKEIIRCAPPLISMFPNLKFSAYKDPRKEQSPFERNNIDYFSIKFNSLKGPAEIIEPIFINLFLWDSDRQKRISETWRFLVDCQKTKEVTKSYFNPIYNDSHLEVMMPEPKHLESTYIIAFLDRLLTKKAGDSLKKYYEKPSKSNMADAISHLEQCKQKGTTITFAYSAKAFTDFTSDESGELKFDSFIPTQNVSDSFLTHAFEAEKSSKSQKPISFQLSFTADAPKENLPILNQFFDLPLAPYTKFENILVIQPIKAKFKTFKGLKHKKNVFAEFRIISDGKILKLFNNGENDVYITRCQYHSDSPLFYEDIIINLPLDFSSSATLRVDFVHASIKGKSKTVRESIGFIIYPLGNGKGSYISNGIHKAGISYDESQETDVNSNDERNQFQFNVILRSSIYPADSEICKIFNNNLTDLNAPKLEELIPHLFSVLDVIFAGINDGKEEAFSGLIQILSLFQKDRDSIDSQALLFYLNHCALRKADEEDFYRRYFKLYYNYLQKTPFTHKRPDFFCIWFFLELIIKAIVLDQVRNMKYITKIIETLSSYLPKFRESGQSIGNSLNRNLCLFYKDLFDVVKDHKIVIDLVQTHLKSIECSNTTNIFDRECFRDFIQYFVSPKIFIYIIAPYKPGHSLFNDLILPYFEATMNVYVHTNDLFKLIFELILQFDPDAFETIAIQISPLLHLIGKSADLIRQYQSKKFQIYPFVIAHFILFYANFDDFDDEFYDAFVLLIKEATHLTEKQINEMDDKNTRTATENITKMMTAGMARLSNASSSGSLRQFASIKKNPFQNQNQPQKCYEETFDALAFCIQSILIKIGFSNPCVKSLNSITSTLLDVEISPYLSHIFTSSLQNIVDEFEKFFLDPNSNMKHIFRRLFERMDPDTLQFVEQCIQKEKELRGKSTLTNALVARSLYKVGVTQDVLEVYKKASFSQLVETLYEINSLLASDDLRKNNYDLYSDLLFRKAELLSDSPDARVASLIELTNYHDEMGYVSESIISELTAAALVAEYLTHFHRIPRYFNCDNPAKKFCLAAPSAISEVVPLSIVNNLPKSRAYCTSKYFCEYGMIYLVMTAMEKCKRAALYELQTKIHSILSVIAEYRHLWSNLKKHYVTGSLAWLVIEKNMTSTDRALGNYYRVQFQDGRNYIYRETKLANLWQVCERLKSSTAQSPEVKGKEVVVVNEGEELNPEKLDADKYYIHVKSVQPYFTSDERKKRVTVFEQNHNINQFYFDLPISKSAQSSIEHCSLKRTIFTLPYPLPYIVKRVEIPRQNIKTLMFSPIEFSCQNLQKQIDLIEEAIARNDFTALQPLLQGSLLVQVNEGPKKIAEVFLGTGNENEHTLELRNIFRQFIEANTRAVLLHAEHAKKNPVFSILQEELDSGLNRLLSSLQPYLK